MKAYKVKDVPVGSLFSLANPENVVKVQGVPQDPCWPPTYLRIEKTEALVNEWNKNLNSNSSDWIKPGEMLALSESGYLCKWDLDLNCYLRAKEPYDQRPKQYWDAFETRYPHVKQTPTVHLERKDVKSGLFFAFNGCPETIYLAVERNADTEFYLKKQVMLKNDKAGMGTDFSATLREANIFCLDKHAVMWTVDKNAYVVLSQNNPTLRNQISATYCETLKKYCADDNTNPAGFPLYLSMPSKPRLVPRKHIKSGQFFKEGNCVYLAIERNKETEFFFARSHRVADTYICADHMLCISSDARMLTTNQDFLVTPAEDTPDLRDHRDQLVSIYNDALKEYCAADNVNHVGLPLYFKEPDFYSPLVGKVDVRTLPPMGTYKQAFAEEIPPRTLVTRSPRNTGSVLLTLERNKSSERAYFLSHGQEALPNDRFCIDADGLVYPLNPQDKLYMLPDNAHKQSYIDAYCNRHAKRVQNTGSMLKYICDGIFFTQKKPGGKTYLRISRSQDNDNDFCKHYPQAPKLDESEVLSVNEFGSPVRHCGSMDVSARVMSSMETQKLTTKYLTAYHRKFGHVPDGLKAYANKCHGIIVREAMDKSPNRAREDFVNLQPTPIRFGPELSIVKDEPADKLPKDIVPRSAIRPGCLFIANGFIHLALDTKELPSYVITDLFLKDHELASISKDGVAYKLNKNTLCELVEQFSDDTRPKTFHDAYLKRFKLIPASEVAKSLEIAKAANQVVSVDGQFTGLENGDGLDATQRLYQDQRDYFKREERKAQAEEIARVKKQLDTVISDPRSPSDFKGDDVRHDELVFAKKNLLNSFHCAVSGMCILAKLDKHGWGNVSRDEEQAVREAVTELQAFIKKWYKKHKKVVGE